MKKFTVRVPDSVDNELRRLAYRMRISKNKIIVQAVRQYLLEQSRKKAQQN